MRFVIVTGMSGAGKSLVTKYLEDIGFFCVDNLPPALIPKFAEISAQSEGKMEKIALVIDIRGGELLHDLFPALAEVKESGFSYEILFLEADDDVLVKRYKESRRQHPLAPEGRLIKGIREERKALQTIKSNANYIIDTSTLVTRQLKQEINGIFLEGKTFKGIVINVVSFGFKYGIPTDCDLVFDVRFIPNPYYIAPMKMQTGKDQMVKEFVLNASETKEFIAKLDNMLDFLIPNYIKEGKSQLDIGIGCTGGRHRSVAIADEIYRRLEEKLHRVVIEHRDIEKDGKGVGK
ncbi:RNase adapter RapZ [Ruminiclostridium papyrosolvens]|uniref:GlmZ(SRNA)-inactivating NTPase n=1 Tax=Ruminiclostridium papyrosolvens C7 TaxID=1330534 RepID=U4R2Y9_9FIRM|nr:RNase adapter RapZ [Ruminiclostridium papyrosolvens]EPR12911.1 glmZ(sRNA)-inactivating NTPase [Ruminiclostridium papyrosolvens C7]